MYVLPNAVVARERGRTTKDGDSQSVRGRKFYRLAVTVFFSSVPPQAPLRPCFCLPSPCFSLGSREEPMTADFRSGEEAGGEAPDSLWTCTRAQALKCWSIAVG